MRCGSWTKDLGHELDMYDLLSCCRDSTAIKLALLLQPCWPYKLKQFNKMLQLTGHATGRCNSQHEEDWDAARQVYWPGQKLMMMMHSTASAHEARICTIYNFVPRDGATCLASAKRSMINPCWLQLDDSTSSTHTHTHTNSFIYLQIHFRRPKCSLILWQPTSPPPPVCLLGKQLFLFCDLVGCARCPLLLLFPWWLMSEISELKVVATLLIAKWLRQRTWTNSGPEQQPATITNALPP